MGGGKKEHVERIKKSKFIRQRNDSVLRDNCKGEGYFFTRKGTNHGAGQCQIHHVLPVAMLQDGQITVATAEDRKFIRNCMAMTDWDCNKQPNLIGLPTKRPYQNADIELSKGKGLPYLGDPQGLKAAAGFFGALPDLPCHLNEHDKYNLDLKDVLQADVWDRLIQEREPCTVKGKDIKQLLEETSDERKLWLQDRGIEEGGAAACWVNRETTERWYIPFSLALEPKEVEAPPLPYGRESKGKKWRSKVFSTVAE
jgi:hypothetical protein